MVGNMAKASLALSALTFIFACVPLGAPWLHFKMQLVGERDRDISVWSFSRSDVPKVFAALTSASAFLALVGAAFGVMASDSTTGHTIAAVFHVCTVLCATVAFGAFAFVVQSDNLLIIPGLSYSSGFAFSIVTMFFALAAFFFALKAKMDAENRGAGGTEGDFGSGANSKDFGSGVPTPPKPEAEVARA